MGRTLDLNPYATPTKNESPEQTRFVQEWLRSLILSTMGVAIFLSTDLFGVPLIKAQGPYVLFGLLVPGNLLSFGVLSYSVYVERNFWWRLMLLLCLFANLISIAFVGMLAIGYILFLDFPGPG